jgi:hypothetical protein
MPTFEISLSARPPAFAAFTRRSAKKQAMVRPSFNDIRTAVFIHHALAIHTGGSGLHSAG